MIEYISNVAMNRARINMEDSIWLINHLSEKSEELLKPAKSLVNSEKIEVIARWMSEECSKMFPEGKFIFQISWVYLLAYASQSDLSNNNALEILAWSCMSLACKISGFSFDLAYARDSTQGRVTEMSITNTEMLLCQKLNWDLKVPTLFETQVAILEAIHIHNFKEIIALSQKFSDEAYLNFTINRDGMIPVAFASLFYALQNAKIESNVLVDTFAADFSNEITLARELIPKF